MATTSRIILDDRLLIEALLVGLAEEGERHTTTYWYYRACRAAVSGAGGHLSGPFLGLDEQRQATAIRSLLLLPDTIGLPDLVIIGAGERAKGMNQNRTLLGDAMEALGTLYQFGLGAAALKTIRNN